MNAKIALTLCLLWSALLPSTGSAQTYSCPSTANLYIENHSVSGNDEMYIGQSYVWDKWWAVVVYWDTTTQRYNSRFLKDTRGTTSTTDDVYLDAGRLLRNSTFCTGAGNDQVDVLNRSWTPPGMVELRPLTFNGYSLSLYTEGGKSNVRGAPGRFYVRGSSSGCDVARVNAENYAGALATVYGGGGADILLGFRGTQFLYGQDGNDVIIDDGDSDFTSRDELYGGNGNDCLGDYDSYSIMSCGAGDDTGLGSDCESKANCFVEWYHLVLNCGFSI